MRARFWVWLLLLLTPSAAMADDPVTISADSAFTGMAPRGGVYPIVVSVHNAGPSADGALLVKSESFSDVLRTYTYPISLPTGTDKKILVYPAVSTNAGQVNISFDGSARAKDVALSVPDRDGMQVGMIGDEPGALVSLRQVKPQSKPTQGGMPPGYPAPPAHDNDCYARPEDAPDRAAGYQSVSVLVLGAGAGRLRPEQWSAIRHWVLDGGSLILLGGAGATALRVPEAQLLLPLADLEQTALTGLRLPQALLPAPLPGGPAALTTGTPAPGALVLASQGGHVVLARQPLGAGAVLLVGFNPLDAPLRGWTGQHDLWMALIRQATATVPTWSLRQWTAQQTSFNEDGGSGGGVTFRPAGVPPSAAQVNPFRIKLPPIATIAWLFLPYFVLVIPVTYIVLKRLGRLEWAWVTSPVLSVAFAYAFYLFTAQLYQAGMSRRTAGVVVAVAGDPEAQFDGFSEMFFPHGGGYKIGVRGAEALELSPFSGSDDTGYAYSASGNSQLQPLETVDMGDVSAPDFQMGNLAFRRLYHTEPVSLGGAVTARLTRDGMGHLRGTVRNGIGQPLTDCGLLQPAAHLYTRIGYIAPGETKTVGLTEDVTRAPADLRLTPFAELPLSRRTSIMGVAGSTFLLARTSGERFGPALGRDVGGPQSVALIVSVPISDSGRRHP